MKTVKTADREVFYADASALVKLIRLEPESAALRNFVADIDIVSSDVVIVELTRTVRRHFADPTEMLRLVSRLIDPIALRPLDRKVIAMASEIDVPGLRSLDAIHVATSLTLGDADGFVTYDERQAAAARLCGLEVFAPE